MAPNTAANALQDGKRRQAQALLGNGEVWLIAARESGVRPEPALTLVAGVDVTWDSLFLLTRTEAVAIVGRFDADAVPPGWTVHGYDADLRALLRAEVTRLGARRVLLNISEDDPLCDGLTSGLERRVRGWLAPGPDLMPDLEWDSAAPLLGQLRSVKTPEEHAAIREAVDLAEAHLREMAAAAHPGWRERDVAAFLHGLCRRDAAEPSWGWNACPNVHIGPDSRPSHAPPGDHALRPGDLLHIDYGVRLSHGYCSDIQRVYRLPDGQPPAAEVQAAFRACWNAIQAGADALRPGTPGHAVDAAARAALVAAGYPEYQHALGHGLGRATHDGGTLLGPRWPRYGQTVEGPVRENEVYTLELGVMVPGHGFIGLEEDVVVRDGPPEWLSERQDNLRPLG
ncbi:Xaa-Pro peptidase family protein [Deinococcus sp. 23YEL01]|uniref:M24 family metallopeptidase n=1 Tax=Deinococcus sp. 23YEL01 TaxID=2745871 RepID=UPI001E28B1EF|nr:Xaa-Pro peptidase family protein [Deinococcus sp. 23YEL01]MCD0171418.1 aminopeptidase P family protein [Deinococcus sp. 23YEL01]